MGWEALQYYLHYKTHPYPQHFLTKPLEFDFWMFPWLQPKREREREREREEKGLGIEKGIENLIKDNRKIDYS